MSLAGHALFREIQGLTKPLTKLDPRGDSALVEAASTSRSASFRRRRLWRLCVPQAGKGRATYTVTCRFPHRLRRQHGKSQLSFSLCAGAQAKSPPPRPRPTLRRDLVSQPKSPCRWPATLARRRSRRWVFGAAASPRRLGLVVPLDAEGQAGVAPDVDGEERRMRGEPSACSL